MSGQANIKNFFAAQKRPRLDHDTGALPQNIVTERDDGHSSLLSARGPSQQEHMAPGSSQPSSRPQKRKSGGTVQLHLDLGQKDFSLTQCHVCGMMYSKGQPADEKLHKQQHQVHTQGMQLQGYSQADIILQDGMGGEVVLVRSSSSSQALGRKLQELCGLIEQLHGMTPGWLLSCSNWKALLYIRCRKVVGLALVEHIKRAYSVAPGGGGGGGAAAGGRGSGGCAPAPWSSSIASLQQLAAATAAASNTPRAAEPAVSPAAVRESSEAAGAGAGAATPGTSAGRPATTGTSSVCSSGEPAAGKHAAQQEEQQQQQEHEPNETSQQAKAIIEQQQYSSCSLAGAQPAPPAQQQQAMPRLNTNAHVSSSSSTPCLRPSPSNIAALAPPPPAAAAAAARLPLVDRSRHVKALCGVRMLWVASQQRRQGVATRLLDLARCHLVPGYVVARGHTAFTQPTAAGAALAAKYCGGSGGSGGFLVYGV